MTLDNAMAMLTQEGRGLGAARLRPGWRHQTDTALHGIRHWPGHAGLNSSENLCFSHFFHLIQYYLCDKEKMIVRFKIFPHKLDALFSKWMRCGLA